MTELVQIENTAPVAVAPPVKDLNSIWSPNIYDHFPFPTIRPPQKTALKDGIVRAYAEGKKFIIIEAPTGSGKCFAPGTMVLMFDGTTKKVEDIVVGDLVMGDNSTPRRVLTLSHGTDEMYDIIPAKGDSYCVNSQHVLSLKVTKGVKTTGGGYHNVQSKVSFYRRNGIIPTAGLKIDVPLNEYLGFSKTQKHTLKGYRTGVSFSEQPVPLSPYFLGLWLGDGSSRGTGITTADMEVANYISNFAAEQGLSVTVEHKTDNLASTYNLVTARGQTNPLLNTLRGLGVSNNKHIPQSYLSNSYENRLSLLAGLIDSDGSRVHGSGFDFVFKSQSLAEGVTFLCRSLGMAAYMSPCEKVCKNTGAAGSYFRISVSGGEIMAYLPAQVKVARKRPTHRLQKKDVLVTGICIESAGRGEFFGFEVDGNHRFLLADFTVVHNSGIALAAASWVKTQPVPAGLERGAYILSPQKTLTAQYMGDFAAMGLRELKGRSNYECLHFVDEKDKPVDCEVGGLLCRSANPKDEDEDEEEIRGCEGCPYKAAKAAFVKSPLGVTNFAYYLAETTYAAQLRPRQMLILDEGHNAENQILSLADITINRFRCDEVGIEFLSIPKIEPGDTESGLKWIQSKFRVAANAKLQQLGVEIRAHKAQGNTAAAAKTGKKLNGLQRFVDKLNLFITAEDLSDWICYTDTSKGSETFGCLIVKPLTATMYADEMLFSKADKVVIMSATILNFDFFMRNLGIDLNDAICIKIPCDFPVEYRPVFIKPIGNMSYKTKQEALPKVAEFLGKILTKYTNNKGIVHTHSYEINRYMIANLPPETQNRIVSHTNRKGEREGAVTRHTDSSDPTVLFSPSMSEGLDLKDDLSRFSVIVKVPYPFMDPWVKARMNRDPEWYSYQTALALIQALGRSNRHKEDKAHHYILDAEFLRFINRAQKMFPDWFLAALVWPK